MTGVAFFAATGAAFTAATLFALTGFTDSLLRLSLAAAEGTGLACSNLVSGISGAANGMSLAMTGSDAAAGTMGAASFLGDLFRPQAMLAPTAIRTATINSGRMEFAEAPPALA